MGDQLYEDLDLIKPIFIFGGCKPSGADFYRRTGLFVLPCCLSSSRRNSSSINPRTCWVWSAKPPSAAASASRWRRSRPADLDRPLSQFYGLT